MKPIRKARGRPPQKPHSLHSPADKGTTELQNKRAQQLTCEPIDLCLSRGIISKSQHRAALHLRWLHTLRYGAPGVTALDLTRGAGQELYEPDNPKWRQQREQDYLQAISLLRSKGYEATLINCIIYQQLPAFLQTPAANSNLPCAAKAHHIHSQAQRFSEGLQLLCSHWKFKPEP